MWPVRVKELSLFRYMCPKARVVDTFEVASLQYHCHHITPAGASRPVQAA
jgi:hypothetical protein